MTAWPMGIAQSLAQLLQEPGIISMPKPEAWAPEIDATAAGSVLATSSIRQPPVSEGPAHR